MLFFFIINLIFLINVNSFHPFSNKINHNRNEFNHLDNENIKKLEKIFYLRNNRYSPYKNLIYLKYKNKNVNTTELLENLNKEYLKSVSNYNNSIENENLRTMFDEAFKDTNNIIENNIDYNNQKIVDRMRNSTKYKVREIIIDKDDDNDNDNWSTFKKTSNYNKNSGGTDNNDHSFQIIRTPTHNFSDIGGYDKIKTELNQVLDILKNNEKYAKYNVRIPHGLIFEGPPGNGKTLLAKGFCGEANMTFIPVSGSEFSEKYVGVGASRIRDLFKLASKNAPSIIFFDEMDALARKRGNDAGNSNSEKDQTLNQLLINMDGFEGNNGVFVIGATNRLDLLDNALLRPGRMDKKIYVGNPDEKTRKSIINIHLKGKPIDPLVSIDSIVEMTGGFSGAQIENLLNEAMLYVLRENRDEIDWSDLEYVNNRILAGWQDSENKFSQDMIDRIIVHELGHAVVGFLSKDHANVRKVVLNMQSPTSPGYTVFESNDENSNIYTKDGLTSHLMVLLAGRIAEEIFYGYSVTSGAKQDLEQAYELAKTMIINYGMGEKNIYPDLSDKSKYVIDLEINKLLVEANEMSYKIIEENRNIINGLISILKEKTVIFPEDIFNEIDQHTVRGTYILINNQYYRMLKND